MQLFHELVDGHPFSMMDEDVIAMTSFSPGFSYDLTRWQIRIASYGLMIQHVSFYESGPLARRGFEEFTCELPEGFVPSITNKAAEIEFDQFPERICSEIDDISSYLIVIRAADGRLKRVIYDRWNHQIDDRISKLSVLWDHIHLHAQYPVKLTKRQSKLEARRERRKKRKEG